MKINCLYDKLVPVSDLNAHPKNPNTHSKEQIERLAKILAYQGWRYPVKVSKRSGFITSGHGRLEAAKLNGWTEVPVNFQDYESEEQERADIVSDNAIAEWSELDLSMINADIGELGPDFDIDLLGIKDFELEPADKREPGCNEDEVPEKVEPKTKPGDLYILGNHRLLCGDSTNIQHVERLMGAEKAELCFTSPPYADQREYNGGKELSTEHLSKFISTVYGHVNYLAVNLGYSRKYGEVNSYWDDYIKEAKECGLKLLSWNVWDRSGKGYTIGQATAMFTIDHEWIFVFGSTAKELNLTVENKHSGNIQHGTIRNKDGTTSQSSKSVTRTHRQLGTVIRTDVERDRKFDHPAKFPVILPQSYIEAMTEAMESVYEPFCGSGSTLIACEKTNRKCFGMEIDPHYCDVIVSRWEKYTGKKAELMNG